MSDPSAFCPRCGKSTPLFALVPYETKTLHSMACPACLTVAGNVVGDPDLAENFARCSNCGGPILARWKFCCNCGKALTRPS